MAPPSVIAKASGVNVFLSQGQAMRFFVDKIVAQAAAEGAPLSDAERQMLSFSESDPDFAVDPALVEKLRAEISDKDYNPPSPTSANTTYDAREVRIAHPIARVT